MTDKFLYAFDMTNCSPCFSFGLALSFWGWFMYKDTKINSCSPFASAWCMTCQGRSELQVCIKENNLSLKSLISLELLKAIIAWECRFLWDLSPHLPCYCDFFSLLPVHTTTTWSLPLLGKSSRRFHSVHLLWYSGPGLYFISLSFVKLLPFYLSLYRYSKSISPGDEISRCKLNATQLCCKDARETVRREAIIANNDVME